MYHQYFGLTEPAFSIAVNPRYLYMSNQHKEALAHLLYGVGGGGFVLLTGEVGTGKTTIIRSLMEQLPEDCDLAMVFNPMAEVPEMLQMICDELGAHYPEQPTVKALTDALYQYLLENHRRGRNTVLLIDEAQLLSPEALEQIRLLTNLETNTQKLLQIILVGQPELNRLLSQPRLRQLAQRITARFHLEPLTLDETRAYIAHRLEVAGLTGDRNPFPPVMVKKIHRFSGGIPRRINILCERALVGLYGHNKHIVDGRVLALAKKEVTGSIEETARRTRNRAPWLWVALSLIALGLASAAGFWLASAIGSAATEPSATPPVAQTPPPSKNASPPALEQADIAPAFTIERFSDAQALLFNYLGSDALNCLPRANSRWQCETQRVDTWQQVRELDRPMLLTLTTRQRFSAYGLLVGLNESHAQLLDERANRHTIPLGELGASWTGQILYAWRRPPGYYEPLGEGDTGSAVSWLGRQFARLDGQSQPLAGNRYNSLLAERVKRFQRQHGLEEDGILGQQTLLRLNQVLGLTPTLRWQEEEQ